MLGVNGRYSTHVGNVAICSARSQVPLEVDLLEGKHSRLSQSTVADFLRCAP